MEIVKLAAEAEKKTNAGEVSGFRATNFMLKAK